MELQSSIDALFKTPFQWKVYLTCTLLNVCFASTGVIGKTIGWCIDVFINEVVLVHHRGQPGKTIDESLQKWAADYREDLGARRPVGKIIGVVERQIYLYAMLSSIHLLVSAVIVFKAFSGWLKVGDHKDVGADSGEIPATKSLNTLIRYYSYAIGNFLSLSWALLIFEVIRALLQYSESWQTALIIHRAGV